ncbi:MAG: ABC transporter permease subunit [Pseudomonadota bacterium]
MLAILEKELKGWFAQPVAWLICGFTLALMAYQFLVQIELFFSLETRLKQLAEAPGVSQIIAVPTVGAGAALILFLAPLLTMQTFAGERRGKTFPLFLASPVSAWEMVLGKFSGVLSIFVCLWSLVALMIATLAVGTTLDWWLLASALAALLLLTMAYVAIGIMTSSLTSQPLIAGISALSIGLGLWLIDWTPGLQDDPGVLALLSSATHFRSLASGIVEANDIIYFLAIAIAALVTAIWRVHGEREVF